MKKPIVALTGASAVLYGIRLLECLREMPEVEVSLVMSKAAMLNIQLETAYTVERFAIWPTYVTRTTALGRPSPAGLTKRTEW